MLLSQTFPYYDTPLAIPIGDMPVRIYYPQDRTYQSITDSWKYLWEASVPLARELHRTGVSGKAVLNLNCGLGIIAMTAKMAGASAVHAVDTYEECPFFISLNSRSNAAGKIYVHSAPPAQLFDIVVAADTIFTLRTHDDIRQHITALMSHVAPNGVLLLGETRWISSEERIGVAESMEFDVQTIYTEELKWWDTPEEKRWSKQVYIHRIQSR